MASPRYCLDLGCDKKLKRYMGQSDFSWKCTKFCPACAKRRLRESRRRAYLKIAAIFRRVELGAAAMLVIRQFNKLYRGDGSEEDFVRLYDERELLFPGTERYRPDFHGNYPFTPKWLVLQRLDEQEIT